MISGGPLAGRNGLTDLDNDSQDGENEELENEQEGRVSSGDDAIRVRVRSCSLVTCDPAATHSSATGNERGEGSERTA